jgi:hypothetical protein
MINDLKQKIFNLLKLNFMNIIERAQAPTPKFFKKVRTGGLLLASLGAAMLSAPVNLSPGLRKIAGYLAVAGGVASAVGQVTSADAETFTTEEHGT